MIHIKRINEMAANEQFDTQLFKKVCKLINDANNKQTKNDVFGVTGIDDTTYCYISNPVFLDKYNGEIYGDDREEEHSYIHNFSKITGAEMLNGFAALISKGDYEKMFIDKYNITNDDDIDDLADIINDFYKNYYKNNAEFDTLNAGDWDDSIILNMTPEHTMELLNNGNTPNAICTAILSELKGYVIKFHHDLDAELAKRFL